jgi:tetratricopeptide (TPR) repeat protein
MKEDPLVTYALRANNFIQRHRITIVVVLAVIVASIAGVSMYRNARIKAQQEVSEGLLRAQMELQRGSLDAAVLLFTNLIERFPRTPGGLEAQVWLGNTYLELNDYQKASEAFEKYIQSGKNDILLRAARRGLAACYEAAGQFARSAEIYEELAMEPYAYGEEKAMNFMAAGRAWELAGEHARAADVYEQAAEAVPESRISREASISAAEAKARSSGEIPTLLDRTSR